MREIKAGLDSIQAANPNLVDIAAREVWKSRSPARLPTRSLALVGEGRPARSRADEKSLHSADRNSARAQHVCLRALVQCLSGESRRRPENIVYSDFTTNEMYRAGSSRGSIDPCFPSKIAIAHFHNLIYTKHVRRPLDCIFLPMFDVLCSPLMHTRACNACPTVAVTPETVEAAYTKEINVFAENHIRYLHPLVNLSERRLFEQQMLECWQSVLGLSEEENHRAVEAEL